MRTIRCLGIALLLLACQPPGEPGVEDLATSTIDQGGAELLALLGGDQTVTIGDRVKLVGRSNAEAGARVVYRWSLEARPGDSRSTLTSNGDTAELVPDLVGDYQVRLEVYDGRRTSAPAQVTIRAQARVVKDDLPNGIFDPGEVYLFGTVSEGLCGRDAIAHWSDPNIAVAGFDCYANERGAQIRPDGTLLYTNTFEDLLREFHCDGCPGWGRGQPYPSAVLNNDRTLTTAACTKISGFLVGATGARLHSCNGAWYDEAGRPLPLTQPLSYGFNDKVLTAGAVVDIKTGDTRPVMGLPSGLLAARVAGPQGFWVAVSGSPEPELWLVTTDGAARREATYAAPPGGYRSRFGARLDRKGNLFQEGSGPMTFEDVVIFRGVDGTSRVLYTEATNPFVKLHISSLVTGP